MPPGGDKEKHTKESDTQKENTPPTKRSSRNLYLSVNNLDWLLAYAADELQCQGVATTDDHQPPMQHGNCSAVADLFLEWDFGEKAWDGRFVQGPFADQRHRFSMSDLDAYTWATLKEMAEVNGYLGRATLTEKKSAQKARNLVGRRHR